MINQSTADELKEQIELGYALKRLETDDDFKKVILQGYIEKTLLHDSMNILYPESSERVIQDIIAVSRLKQYLNSTNTISVNSVEDLGEIL